MQCGLFGKIDAVLVIHFLIMDVQLHIKTAWIVLLVFGVIVPLTLHLVQGSRKKGEDPVSLKPNFKFVLKIGGMISKKHPVIASVVYQLIVWWAILTLLFTEGT